MISDRDDGKLTAVFVPEGLPCWYVVEIEKESGIISSIIYDQLPWRIHADDHIG